jgi:hypothetical protein
VFILSEIEKKSKKRRKIASCGKSESREIGNKSRYRVSEQDIKWCSNVQYASEHGAKEDILYNNTENHRLSHIYLISTKCRQMSRFIPEIFQHVTVGKQIAFVQLSNAHKDSTRQSCNTTLYLQQPTENSQSVWNKTSYSPVVRVVRLKHKWLIDRSALCRWNGESFHIFDELRPWFVLLRALAKSLKLKEKVSIWRIQSSQCTYLKWGRGSNSMQKLKVTDGDLNKEIYTNI